MPFDQITGSRFVNPITGHVFKGQTNLAALAAAGLGPHWATFNQWKSSGRFVRKGQTGVTLHGRGFSFRVFEESQTQLVEATPTPPQTLAAISAPVVDPDYAALAADYLCDGVRKLYWAGQADALDRNMGERVVRITARNDNTRDVHCYSVAVLGLSAVSRLELHAGLKALGKYAAELYRLGSVTPIRSAWNDAPAKPAKAKATRAKAMPGNWQRHPVTGAMHNVPAGRDLRDLIPFGHDPKTLKAVRAEWSRHGRIGLANTLVWLETTGRKTDATDYRKRAADRRREHGPVSFSYGPKPIDRTKVLEAVTYGDDGREHRASL